MLLHLLAILAVAPAQLQALPAQKRLGSQPPARKPSSDGKRSILGSAAHGAASGMGQGVGWGVAAEITNRLFGNRGEEVKPAQLNMITVSKADYDELVLLAGSCSQKGTEARTI